ncbi:MAG: 5-guanidino-2-oxopentanoate decarboxylase [Pseudomonadota bacterium]
MSTLSVGEALIAALEDLGVDTVFGIPGVHTVELYRGLAGSAVRHVTPRHEQGAAFMADGYARVTGRPGVCLLITGPGFTNAITAIAQARADSVPMLILSGVNPIETRGRHLGLLHELPDQAALSRTVCLKTWTLTDPEALGDVLTEAFVTMTHARPRPVHIEIPTDVMKMRVLRPRISLPPKPRPAPTAEALTKAARLCTASRSPLILAGGGCVPAAASLRNVAAALDAPVVSTINARGVMAGHPLNLPVSPSLDPVRDLMARSDLVLALGTEMGRTDYDMYDRGALPPHPNLVRVDIDPEQLTARGDSGLQIIGDAGAFLDALHPHLSPEARGGAARAAVARRRAMDGLSPAYRRQIEMIEGIWRALPDAIIVGDSTQPVYAGNLLIDAPCPGAWFNSATGYGTLGYALPAAIGAAIGAPDRPVVALTGDGGLQFSLSELGSAADIDANVTTLVWNNAGYQEIEAAMLADDVTPVGVTPSAPDFVAIARAYGLHADRLDGPRGVPEKVLSTPRPALLDIRVSKEI